MYESFENRISREYSRAFELALLTAFEEHLGRVPTNDEVATYSHQTVWPTGQRDVMWGDKRLFQFPNAMDWARENLK